MKISVRLTEQNQDSYLSFEDLLRQENVRLPIGVVDEIQVEEFIRAIAEAIGNIRSGRREKVRESVQCDKERISKQQRSLDNFEQEINVIRIGLNAQYDRLRNWEENERLKSSK